MHTSSFSLTISFSFFFFWTNGRSFFKMQPKSKNLTITYVTCASSILQIPIFSWIFVIYSFLLGINYSRSPFSANEENA